MVNLHPLKFARRWCVPYVVAIILALVLGGLFHAPEWIAFLLVPVLVVWGCWWVFIRWAP